MCFTVQLSRLSVFASRLTAHLLYHLLFALSRTFLFYFLSSFSSASATLIQYHVFSFLSTLFLYFFQLYSTNLCCLSKKIRLTQKRIYHIIIFFLRQVLFYIFLHIFYAISDIAIISSFLTPQYQSKEIEQETAFAADLSHHRTCGSASGGSVNLTSRFTKIFLG